VGCGRSHPIFASKPGTEAGFPLREVDEMQVSVAVHGVIVAEAGPEVKKGSRTAGLAAGGEEKHGRGIEK